MIYEPIPHKQCSKCKLWFFATREYFHPAQNTKDRLYSSCKSCKNKIKREYHTANRTKERADSRLYHQTHREQIYERKKLRRQLDPSAIHERERLYRLAHLEQDKAKILRYRQRHPDRVRAQEKRRQNLYPEKHRQKEQRRRARKRQLPFGFTEKHWTKALEYWHGGCAYCGNPPSLWDNPRVLVQEHFIPVSAGGGYTSDNILPACRTCNAKKRDANAIDWLIECLGKRKATLKIKEIRRYFEWISSLGL